METLLRKLLKNYYYNKMSKKYTMELSPRGPLYTLMCVLTAMVGYHIHHSLFWSIIDFFFMPIAWLKWLICQEVNMTVIRATFSFFFN